MNEYDPNYVETKNFYLIGVKVAIVNSKNEYLILKRSDKTPRAGGWDLAGGATDADESPEAAAIREVVEETGIVVPQAQIVASDYVGLHDEPWVMLGFGVRVDNPELILSWEHDEYQWVPFEEIESTGLPEPYKRLVRSYHELTA